MSSDLKTKLENINTQYQNMCYQMIALEQAYDDTTAEEALTYLKHKIQDLEGEMFANRAVFAAINHRLDQKV